jgi:hypothetical protein
MCVYPGRIQSHDPYTYTSNATHYKVVSLTTCLTFFCRKMTNLNRRLSS